LQQGIPRTVVIVSLEKVIKESFPLEAPIDGKEIKISLNDTLTINQSSLDSSLFHYPSLSRAITEDKSITSIKQVNKSIKLVELDKSSLVKDPKEGEKNIRMVIGINSNIPEIIDVLSKNIKKNVKDKNYKIIAKNLYNETISINKVLPLQVELPSTPPLNGYNKNTFYFITLIYSLIILFLLYMIFIVFSSMFTTVSDSISYTRIGIFIANIGQFIALIYNKSFDLPKFDNKYFNNFSQEIDKLLKNEVSTSKINQEKDKIHENKEDTISVENSEVASVDHYEDKGDNTIIENDNIFNDYSIFDMYVDLPTNSFFLYILNFMLGSMTLAILDYLQDLINNIDNDDDITNPSENDLSDSESLSGASTDEVDDVIEENDSLLGFTEIFNDFNNLLGGIGTIILLTFGGITQRVTNSLIQFYNYFGNNNSNSDLNNNSSASFQDAPFSEAKLTVKYKEENPGSDNFRKLNTENENKIIFVLTPPLDDLITPASETSLKRGEEQNKIKELNNQSTQTDLGIKVLNDKYVQTDVGDLLIKNFLDSHERNNTADSSNTDMTNISDNNYIAYQNSINSLEEHINTQNVIINHLSTLVNNNELIENQSSSYFNKQNDVIDKIVNNFNEIDQEIKDLKRFSTDIEKEINERSTIERHKGKERSFSLPNITTNYNEIIHYYPESDNRDIIGNSSNSVVPFEYFNSTSLGFTIAQVNEMEGIRQMEIKNELMEKTINLITNVNTKIQEIKENFKDTKLTEEELNKILAPYEDKFNVLSEAIVKYNEDKISNSELNLVLEMLNLNELEIKQNKEIKEIE